MTDNHTASDVRKAALRSQLRRQRNALSGRQQQAAASSAAEILTQHPDWANARSIVLYQAADGELDPSPIAARARAENKLLFLPVINGTGLLAFHPWEKEAQLVVNQYGIPEPVGGTAVAAEQLDIICLPLVGWDERGGRLGMGGGYYDRALAGVSGPSLVGLAHECQQTDDIPLEAWDVRLQFVVTGKALYACQGTR